MGPLQGIKVIELGTMITAPLTGMLFGQAGADVTKVEHPQGGDPFRSFRGGLYSPNFMAFNQAKKSVKLNLQNESGREAFRRLLKDADVLVHMNHYKSGTEPTEIYRLVCGNPIDTAHVARAARAKLLVLTHMLEQIDQPGVREDILRQMAAIYDGPIIWGEDLMEVPVKGPRLARME